MTTWLVPRTHLTDEQLRAVEAPARAHRVIVGPPGSGKTVVLLHRAQHLRDKGLGRCHIITYNNALKAYVRSAAEFLGLDVEALGTADALFRALYEQHVSKRVPWDKEAKVPDFAAIRRELLAAATSGKISSKPFDAILVDEGQDLSEDAITLLGSLASHVTVMMDGQQRLYSEGATEDVVARSLGIKAPRMTFLGAYRVNPLVAQFATNFIADTAQRALFLKQVRTEQKERQMPMVFVARSIEEETKRIVEVVQSRVAQGERVAVLFPKKSQVFGYAHAFRSAGVEVEVPHQSGKNADNSNEHDFTSDRPKLLTYQGAKGMTFDSVLLPRIVKSSFYKVDPLPLLFVGLTRAVKWAFVSTIEGAELPALETLLGGGDTWIVQRAEDVATPDIEDREDDLNGLFD